jgi:hypothetical protein
VTARGAEGLEATLALDVAAVALRARPAPATGGARRAA